MDVDGFVSIPYSSGLRFRCYAFALSSAIEKRSQSLIHQVSDSDMEMLKCQGYFQTSQSLIHQVSDSDGQQLLVTYAPLVECLNPLFIRSQIQIAPFFLNTNTDSYNSISCNLYFSSLFSSLRLPIFSLSRYFLSMITNNYKFPVTTPFFDSVFNSVQLSKLYTHLRF